MATVQKRNDTYRIRASCGYDINGKQIIKSVTWAPAPGMSQKQIDKELQRQTVLFEEKCRAGLCLDDNITLHDFCVKWFDEYVTPNLAPKTAAGYKNNIGRVYTALGHKKLSQIKPAHIMEFYKNLRQDGIRGDIKYSALPALSVRLNECNMTQIELSENAGVSISTVYKAMRVGGISPGSAEKIAGALNRNREQLFIPIGDDKPLSDKTLSEYHRLLHVIFKTAMNWQYITHNPCDMVTPPKAKRKEAVYLNEVQAAQLLEYLQNEPVKPRTMVQLLIYSGLRRGELCGLYWDDIDEKRKLLTVRRSTQYLPDRGIFDKDTKTESSKRTIRLPDIAFSVLDEYREWQSGQRAAMGDKWKNTNRIFCDDFGGAISPDYITQWFHKFIKKTDLPQVHIHSLRHTNATLLIAGNVPLRTVSARLGHAQMTTTANIYAHAIQSADEAAADTLQDLLNPGKQKQ